MSKLQAQWRRLYLPPSSLGHDLDVADTPPALIDANGQVRAMVLGVAPKAGWEAVAGLWQGVQDDLELPAPAVAVSGGEGYQVWFSLASPVPVAQAHAFLVSLRQRYLGSVAPRHLTLQPSVDTGSPGPAQHASLVPARQGDTDRWSAFVAPGLAGLFAEESWLAVPPNPDAQANLLAGLQSIKPADFQRVQHRLAFVATAVAHDPTPAPVNTVRAEASRPQDGPLAVYGELDPKGFLLAVMNDPAVALGFRLDAAKALLPYVEGPISPGTAGT